MIHSTCDVKSGINVYVCVCTGHVGRLRHSAQAKFAGANRRLADINDEGQAEGSRKLFTPTLFLQSIRRSLDSTLIPWAMPSR